MRIRLASTLALLAVALLAVALPASASARGQHCNGMKRLCDRRLDQVVLPGAHNAMSSESLGFLFPNQSVAIPEQLDGGIRALLLDTHYGRLQPDGRVRTDDDGNVSEGVRGTYLCHEFCEAGATKLAPALRQIRKWLRHNPDEVLLIENEDYISSNDFVSAMRRSGLLDLVYRGPRAPWPTLGKMIAKDHRVVMLADRNSTGDPAWYRPTYEGLMQETPYTFDPPSELTDPANWEQSCRPNRGGTDGSLFLMNHWSPSTPPLHPDLAQSAQVNASDVILGRAMECARVRGRLPTLIAVDQFTAGGLIRAVRKLNRLPASPAPARSSASTASPRPPTCGGSCSTPRRRRATGPSRPTCRARATPPPRARTPGSASSRRSSGSSPSSRSSPSSSSSTTGAG